jgi:hypothetical protein
MFRELHELLLSAYHDLFVICRVLRNALVSLLPVQDVCDIFIPDFSQKKKKKEIGKKNMKKLLCVPIVMCFSLLLLQLAANILSLSLSLMPPFPLPPSRISPDAQNRNRAATFATRSDETHFNAYKCLCKPKRLLQS